MTISIIISMSQHASCFVIKNLQVDNMVQDRQVPISGDQKRATIKDFPRIYTTGKEFSHQARYQHRAIETTHEQGILFSLSVWHIKRPYEQAIHSYKAQDDPTVMAVDRDRRSVATNKLGGYISVSFCVLSIYALQIVASKDKFNI